MRRASRATGRRGRRVAFVLVLTLASLPVAAGAQARSAPSAPPAPPAPEVELQRVQAELRAMDQLVTRLQQGLRTRPAQPLLDSLQSTRTRQRALRAREQLLATRADARTRVQIRTARAPEPRGWLGVEFNGAMVQQTPAGPMLVSMNAPSIYSVTPGSPAQRAGLLPGDRIIAIAGTDVRRGPVALDEVLQPGRRVAFRIERDGRARDVRVQITEAPQRWIALRLSEDSALATALTAALPGWETPWSVRVDTIAGAARTFTRTLGRTGFDTTASARTTVRGTGGQSVTFSQRASGGDTATSVRVTIVNPNRSISPSPFVFSTTDEIALLGAAFRAMTRGMRAELNAREGGVLVVDVAPETPAGRAGLRPMDVLVRANGELVVDPSTLLHLVRSADGELRVELVREAKPRQAVVRW